jgi:basic amino acid/polyamine antiporter, APA family
MPLVRSIGRWTMTALVINTIIGSGVFGLPAELTRLLGRASPFAIIVGALGVAIIMACMAEVASQFSEPGGPYHYVRTTFGPFFGIQIGWFHLLSIIGAVAAVAHLFMDYLVTFVSLSALERDLLLAILFTIPAVTNHFGVRAGANLSNIMTVAKLSPLTLLILFGVGRFVHQPQGIHASELLSPGLSNWVRAFIFLIFLYGGWEDTLIVAGEVKEPRRTIPFGLLLGLLVCTGFYILLQFITLAAIGTNVTERPLAAVASVLIGRSGAAVVAIAAMVSTYGWVSASLLNAPRLLYSFAAQGDFPGVFARLDPRYQTPTAGIILFALTGWLLAVSGTFLWIVALSAASMIIYYAATCACLGRLRKMHPRADAFRVPFGRSLSMAAIGIALLLMTGLHTSEALLMCVTAVIATANWLLVRRRRVHPALHVTAVP